ncbi:MAG: response regulator [Pseudomonadota bacterium]|nr:response regulator [Pseudomonadota bacterium]
MKNSNVEIKKYIETHFENFSVDESLCSTESLKLSEAQLAEIIHSVIAQLPGHLSERRNLKLTLQASFEDHNHYSQSIAIKISTQTATSALIQFEAKITPNEIAVYVIDERALADIRKPSLNDNDRSLILIIDDEAVTRKVLATWLVSNSVECDPLFEILTSSNGEEAVKLYKANYRCSCIFMDQQMAVMDGIEASIRIRQFEKNHGLKPIPIIGMSAGPISAETIAQCGWTRTLNKPLGKARVLEALASLGLIPLSEPNIEEVNNHTLFNW